MTLRREEADIADPTTEPGSPRRIKPTTFGTAHVDGAWQAPTDDPTVSLTDLLALLGPRVRPMTRVIHHPRAWRKGVPTRRPTRRAQRLSRARARGLPTQSVCSTPTVRDCR
jgi:hypothetical protein